MGQNCCTLRPNGLNHNIVDGKTYMIAPPPEMEEQAMVLNDKKELSFNNGQKKVKTKERSSDEEVTSQENDQKDGKMTSQSNDHFYTTPGGPEIIKVNSNNETPKVNKVEFLDDEPQSVGPVVLSEESQPQDIQEEQPETWPNAQASGGGYYGFDFGSLTRTSEQITNMPSNIGNDLMRFMTHEAAQAYVIRESVQHALYNSTVFNRQNDPTTQPSMLDLLKQRSAEAKSPHMLTVNSEGTEEQLNLVTEENEEEENQEEEGAVMQELQNQIQDLIQIQESLPTVESVLSLEDELKQSAILQSNVVEEPILKAYDKKKLNIILLKYQFLKLNEQGNFNKMEIKLYTDLLTELLKLFLHLGSAIRFAFSDIQEKASKLIKNQNTIVDTLKLVEPGSPQALFIEQFVILEIQQGLAFMNGSNNADILKQSNCRFMLTKYQSSTWTFIRGAWFFDYLVEVFRLLYHERQMSMTNISLQAYDTALSRHHPWVIQKAAKTGMYACTSRKVFFKRIMDEQSEVLGFQFTEEMLYEDIHLIHEQLVKLSKHIWSFCERNGVKNVP